MDIAGPGISKKLEDVANVLIRNGRDERLKIGPGFPQEAGQPSFVLDGHDLDVSIGLVGKPKLGPVPDADDGVCP